MMKRLVLLTAGILMFAAPFAHAAGQNIIKVSSDVNISKETAVDEVVVVGGNVIVEGRVEHGIVVVGGSVTLKEHSYVGQEIVVVGGDVAKDPSATVGGKITEVYLPPFIPSFTTFLKGGWIAIWATISILVLLGFLGLTILLTALIPEHVGTIVNALEKSFFAMFLWGVLWLILVIPIAVLLAISIIGIILIPLEILVVALALIIGYISSAVFIGKNILLAFKKMPPPFVDAILGILILSLTGFVPVIGPAVKALFLVAGFGAVMAKRFGTVK